MGYGLPVGARFVGTPQVSYSASQYGRDYRVGYTLGVLGSESLRFELATSWHGYSGRTGHTKSAADCCARSSSTWRVDTMRRPSGG